MASSFWLKTAVILLLGTSAYANSAEENELKLYKEIVESTLQEEVAADSLLEKTVFTGLSYQPIRPACDPRRLEENLLNATDAKDYQKIAQIYMSSCSSDLTRKSDTGLKGLLKFVNVKYDLFKNPHIKPVKIPLGGNKYVPGILAVKPDKRARPFVIVKCGVFCPANESGATRNYIMNLFDQSPFNVLLLANQTGIDYIQANSEISLGGWSEGYEAHLVGQWLQKSWTGRNSISSLHFMGISLGGNAALISTYYNDQASANGSPLFNSVAAICPVVNLEPTLEKLYSGQVVGRAFAFTTLKQFKDGRTSLPHLSHLLTDDRLPRDRNRLPAFIADLAVASLQHQNVAMTPTEWFRANNYLNYSGPQKTPLLLWASLDDIIVNNAINTASVEKSSLYAQNRTIGLLNMQYGNHCAFNTAYGSQLSATILRSWVLKHSPEFHADMQERRERVSREVRTGANEMHIQQEFAFSPHSNSLKLTFRIYQRSSLNCRLQNAYNSSSACQREVTLQVPIADYAHLGARRVSSEVEAQALTREFNSKVEIVTSAGRPLTGTSVGQFELKWRNF